MTNPKKVFTILTISMLACGPSVLSAGESESQSGATQVQGGWRSSVHAGAVYQSDTDLDEGGSYTATRSTASIRTSYGWDRRNSVGVSLGYSYDGYDFSGSEGLSGRAPWDDIHTLSVGVPMRLGVSDQWTAFVIPSFRSTGESGADFDQTLTGGLLSGASYRVSERLTVGPGIGIFSQLEDSATVIPILIIDWKISDTWSLNTGGGLGATLGPGLVLNYTPNKMWQFGVGGRYEKLRFRLDENNSVSSGVGEDASLPLFVSARYSASPSMNISCVGGIELEGELSVEDEDGQDVVEESYDPGVFLGLTFNARF